ncbi:MAG: hypothetical protein ABIU63_16655 [Chitinophagaceae bacterium]
MKNLFLAASVVLLLAVQGAAQTSETVHVAAGNDIAAAVSAYGIYRLPVFTKGTVFFSDGKLAKENLNYNIMNDQVMYIDQKGDTLAVAFPEEIKKIDINGLILYYTKKGWLEDIAAIPSLNLLVKRTINIHYAKEGAFGIANSTNGIDSYTTFTSNNASYHLVVSEDAMIKKITAYYLLTTNDSLLPATKSNFLDRFPGNKKNIEAYLANNKVNFSKSQDLIQLFSVAVSGN